VSTWSKTAPFIAASALTACLAQPEGVQVTGVPDAPPSAPVLRRLTAAQLENSIVDLFGADILLTRSIEPDLPSRGLIALGSSETTISSWGVEQYEALAFDVAEQAMASPALRAQLGAEEHQGLVDREAIGRFASQLAKRAWRRPATDEELAALVSTGTTAAAALGDYHQGLELVIAAILQSPSFLFRVELGNNGDLDAYELATRLSYFLWNSTPDDELLAAADGGALLTEEGLRDQAERLLASPRARVGLRAFFSDVYVLQDLDHLDKDPDLFPHFNSDLGALAREETLRNLEALVFDEQGDFRDLFVREKTFVDRRLAALYGVRAPSATGFGQVVLPPEGGRRGLLGQVSVLALHAHPVSSSATLRGKFVREVLLCSVIPPPPVGVNTALPEPTGTALTLRDRVGEHLTSPNCRGCHLLMDPIGLALENFDGVGRWRDTDNGARIDASADLDGVAIADAWSLGQVLHDNPAVPQCLVRNIYRYATGVTEPESGDALAGLAERFAARQFRVAPMMVDVIMSPAFRRVERSR
jgi:hypothetical protein